MKKCALSSPLALALAPLALVSLVVLSPPRPSRAQEVKAAPVAPIAPSAAEREHLVAAAREIMTAQTYCAFITVDRDGRPQARTINPFPPEEDLTVWFATNILSRKVQEIRDNPHVVVYYADHSKATGYVALSGRAVLVSDQGEIARHRRAYWAQTFPGDRNLVLVKVVPERLDVINYKAGTKMDSVTWRSPSIELGPAAKK